MMNTVGIMNKIEQIGGKENDTNYIEFEFEEDTNFLIARTTSSFKNYELLERVTTIVVQLTLNCATGSISLITDFNLNKKNNYDPKFNEEVYNSALPLPLPKDFDITKIIGDIYVTDHDLFDNKVTVTTTSPDFNVGDVTPNSDGRTFEVHILTSHQLLRIDDKIEFELTATDQGTPPRSSKVTVKFTSDTDINYVETPAFEKAIYESTLKSDLTIDPIVVSITSTTYSDDIKIRLEECK